MTSATAPPATPCESPAMPALLPPPDSSSSSTSDAMDEKEKEEKENRGEETSSDPETDDADVPRKKPLKTKRVKDEVKNDVESKSPKDLPEAKGNGKSKGKAKASPVKPTKSTKPAKPAKSAKPTKPAKPVKTAKTAKTTKPTKGSKKTAKRKAEDSPELDCDDRDDLQVLTTPNQERPLKKRGDPMVWKELEMARKQREEQERRKYKSETEQANRKEFKSLVEDLLLIAEVKPEVPPCGLPRKPISLLEKLRIATKALQKSKIQTAQAINELIALRGKDALTQRLFFELESHLYRQGLKESTERLSNEKLVNATIHQIDRLLQSSHNWVKALEQLRSSPS